MPTLSPARLGVAVGALLAVLAAGVAAMVLFAAGKAGEVDLTTADFVPADAGLYLAFNTDLSSSPWVHAFKLAERLGENDPEGSLRNAVGAGNLDWDDDVAPFLGGNAAIYLKSVDIELLDARGGVVVKCQDCAKALRVLRRESGFEFENREYEGLDYLDGGFLFVTSTKGHLLVAIDEDSLFEMMDLARGEGASLASTADFKRLRDEVSKDFLAFAYASVERLAVAGFIDDPIVRQAFMDAGVGDVAFKPMAMAIAARSGGFETQAASVGEPGTSSPLLEPHVSKFAAMVPANSALFFHTTGVGRTWEAVLKDGRPQIDEAVRESTPYRDLDEALQAVGEQVGLSSIADIMEQLTGETAVAMWFPDGDQEQPEVVLLAEVADPAEAARILRRLAQSAGDGQLTTRRVAGTEVTLFRDDNGDEVGLAVRDSHAILGTAEAVTAVLELKGSGLAGSARYRGAVGGLSAPTGTFGYFDLPLLLRLAEGGLVPELDEAEKALGPAIINIVSDQGLARMLAFVSVPE